MRRIAASLILVTVFLGPIAYGYSEDGDGNGSGDGCYHGGCNTHHRHDGDTCISPCSITIIVPPVDNSPSTTTTTRQGEKIR